MTSNNEPVVKRYRPQAEASREVAPPPSPTPTAKVPELGGRKDGTDPTRYGDWEKNGRCIDF